MKNSPPSFNNVCSSIIEMVPNLRSEMKNKTTQDIINYRGGMSFDGLKEERKRRKYYDFVSQFIKVRLQDCALRDRKWKMLTLLLFTT